MNETLQVYSAESKQVTARDIRAQVNMIQEVMRSVMKNGIHYGTIPGTPKPTLYKPGAEKILMTFQLVCGDPQINDLSVTDEARYRVVVPITTRNGVLVGSGCGECSSSEEKYRWRKPVCEEEFNETPEDRKRVKWFKGRQGEKPYQQKQIRMQPADVANTILKMAHKRALVAATLVTTAASDVFDQDIEDLPDGVDVGGGTAKPPVEMPKAKPATKPADAPPAPQDGQLTVTGTVDQVSKKEGTGKRGAWTKYGVLVDGAWYSTFDAKAGELAESLEGKEARIVYTTDGKYNNIVSIGAAAPEDKPAASTDALVAQVVALMEQVKPSQAEKALLAVGSSWESWQDGKAELGPDELKTVVSMLTEAVKK